MFHLLFIVLPFFTIKNSLPKISLKSVVYDIQALKMLQIPDANFFKYSPFYLLPESLAPIPIDLTH